jgi:hypothetical protein
VGAGGAGTAGSAGGGGSGPAGAGGTGIAGSAGSGGSDIGGAGGSDTAGAGGTGNAGSGGGAGGTTGGSSGAGGAGAGGNAAGCSAPDVVVSQIFGGGNNTGASYENDFVEIFNRSDVAVDLTGWSVQFAASSGNVWGVTPLAGLLQPGQHYLVREAGGTINGLPLPTPDASGTLNLSAASGKVALVSSVTNLTSFCATEASVVDFVPFGSASCTPAAPGGSNATAIIRNGGGCFDTGSNTADFAIGAPTPRNTGDSATVCAACN